MKATNIKRPSTTTPIVALLWLVSISGCSGYLAPPELLPAATPSPSIAASWAAHQHQLQALEAWTVIARLALRRGAKSNTASVHWQQQQQQYAIRLSGILGLGLTTIVGDAERLIVTTPKRKLNTSGDLQTWLQCELGFRIPVAQLRWWLRGVLAPAASPNSDAARYPEVQYRLNSEGRLAQLQQHGWRIQYSRYARFDGFDLPTRIRLQYTPPSADRASAPKNTELRLAISRWEKDS